MNSKRIYNSIFWLCVVLITYNSSCKNPSIDNNPTGLSVNIKLLKEYKVLDSIYSGYEYESLPKQINNKRYDIQISLENNSDTIINIILMTCSWDETIIINTPYINDVREDCNSNYPHIVTIKPHEQFVLTTTLEKSKHFHECETCPDYLKSVTLKLGLIYIPYIDNDKPFFREYDRIMNDKSLWNIIWSNALNIEK